MHRTIKAFLPGMLERGGGSIVNIASGASSVRGIPNRYVYGATKAAVIGLTKAVAADFIRRGIRATRSAPARSSRPRWTSASPRRLAASGQSVEAVARPSSTASRWGASARPRRSRWLAVHLASDEASYTTGQIISWTAGSRCDGLSAATAVRPSAASPPFGVLCRIMLSGKQGVIDAHLSSSRAAAGMVGRKLSERLAKDGASPGARSRKLTLHDVVEPQAPAEAPFPPRHLTSDFAQPGEVEKLVADRPDVIFHLAAIVSGEAEADFEKGDRINLDGTRFLFDAIRRVQGYTPRLVFTSSIAVFGAPFPEAIGDEFFLTPLTSYGTQKAIGELLLNRLHPPRLLRRGRHPAAHHLRAAGQAQQGGLGLLLQHHPRALNGEEAVLPVAEDVRHAHASPRSAVGFLLHAARIDGRTSRPPPQPHHAVRLRHGRRADRGLAPHRRRTSSPASAASPIR